MPRGAGEELIRILRGFDRQALHARRLAFRHPRSSEVVTFEAPIPRDHRELLAALAADAKIRT